MGQRIIREKPKMDFLYSFEFSFELIETKGIKNVRKDGFQLYSMTSCYR